MLGAGERAWLGSLAVSMVLHMLLIVAFGLLYRSWVNVAEAPEHLTFEAIDAEQLRERTPEIQLTTLHVPTRDEQVSPAAGGADALLNNQAAESRAARTALPVKTVTAPTLGSWTSVGFAGQSPLQGQMGQAVPPLYTASVLHGAGQGQGEGEGDGQGGGFFGRRGRGKSFVYVVDCSGSMNYPHPSEWKTRFQRVKYEILKSVAKMPPENRFFIIFFNQHPHPMPARELISTDPDRAHPYLAWMSRVRAQDETDPRKALQLALKLQPDVIFFLTDGAFSKKIQSSLARIQQETTAIHTFSFGQKAGESTLRDLANRNGGEYHFVP